MILSFVFWCLFITLLGWVVFPMTYRLLPGLRDRGYLLARAAGLLLWGYVFWLGGSLGWLQNDAGGELLALALVLGLVVLLCRKGMLRSAWDWVKVNRGLVIFAEVLFFLAFVGWAVIRSANPEISGTEKPMEFAFINSILRSPSFPPNDPWLSGYSISYYYFGYVMVAMLIRLTGTAPEVGFNLANSLWFALIVLGAYGVVYNLWSLVKDDERLRIGVDAAKPGLGFPLLGPLFVMLIGNLDGLLEVLHSRGIFWVKGVDGAYTSPFWQSWLNVEELNQPPILPFSWMPNRPGGVLWWRASRVLGDLALDKTPREIIDEFPFFSFLLGDLHPHVLAFPFALLAIGLALNLYMTSLHPADAQTGNRWMPIPWTGLLPAMIALGGLAFLNTWDFPIYVGFFCTVFLVTRWRTLGWTKDRLTELIGVGIVLLLGSVTAYLPFYLGFSSQAGGVIPSVIFFTRGAQLWVMFGILLTPVMAFLIYLAAQYARRTALLRGLLYSLALVVGLWLLSFGLAGLIGLLPDLGLRVAALPGWGERAQLLLVAGQAFLGSQGAGSLSDDLSQAFVRRMSAPGAWITLLVLIGLALAWFVRWWRRNPAPSPEDEAQDQAVVQYTFPVIMILFGGLLVLAPEFFYLRDQFGYRINTIFKFYYQGWLVWGLAAAFGTAVCLQKLRGARGWLFRFGTGLLILSGLIYPVIGLRTKTDLFSSPTHLTLDGMAYRRVYAQDELAAIQWLRAAPYGVIAEAVGGSYTDYARFSANSGLPTVLGWPGHESQWRGGAAEMGSRQDDIQRLYQTPDWSEAKSILGHYNIRYVVIGSLETSAYRVNDRKFTANLKLVFQIGGVAIYEVPPGIFSIPTASQEGQ